MDLLAGLPPDERRRVLQQARRRRFAKGEILFHEGDPADSLHVIDRGRVAVKCTTPLGDVATFDVLGPGAALGELALLPPRAPRSATAVALEPVETLVLGEAVFTELRHQLPAVEEALVAHLAARVRALSDRLVEALFVPADVRILRRLLEVAELYPDGTVPLTQEDVAALAGTTRPTANRVLRREEERGAVSVGRGRVTILDPAALAKRAR